MQPAAVQEWRPTCTAAHRRLRAEVNRAIREFFFKRGVLEVETPLVSRCGNPDPAIESLRLAGGGYLRTSPEFAHKRLLAAGAGPIYELGRVFRAGESGAEHNPEFTLLEWYRPGFDPHALMAEVADLVRSLYPPEAAPEVVSTRYADAIESACGIDPLAAADSELEACARRIANLDGPLDRRRSLDLLLALGAAPDFPAGQITQIYDFPACQAALARISEADPRVAHRFEVFVGPVELANGYDELCDAGELEARFVDENRRRRAAGQEQVAPDARLLGATRAGIGPCAGVALGVDRLLMVLAGVSEITAVIEFPWERA